MQIVNGKAFTPQKHESGYFFCVTQGATGRFVGLAKREPFVSDHEVLITEPGDLWFEYGKTPDEALLNIKKSLLD